MSSYEHRPAGRARSRVLWLVAVIVIGFAAAQVVIGPPGYQKRLPGRPNAGSPSSVPP